MPHRTVSRVMLDLGRRLLKTLSCWCTLNMLQNIYNRIDFCEFCSELIKSIVSKYTNLHIMGILHLRSSACLIITNGKQPPDHGESFCNSIAFNGKRLPWPKMCDHDNRYIQWSKQNTDNKDMLTCISSINYPCLLLSAAANEISCTAYMPPRSTTQKGLLSSAVLVCWVSGVIPNRNLQSTAILASSLESDGTFHALFENAKLDDRIWIE